MRSSEAAFHDAAGDVAGTHDRVVGIVRDGETIEDALHRSAGRGALVIRMTVPPRRETAASASQAAGKAATPLCTTPQTSHRRTS